MTRLPTGASRWQQVKSLLDKALALPAEERETFLEGSCGSDPSLRAELESLLAQSDSASFLTDGVARAAAEAFDLAETVDLKGVRLGPWRIVHRIGEGGMGAVYLAERDDGEFNKQVAIKVIRQRVATPAGLRRFRTERQILAAIDHPNVARLLDAGTTDDELPYLVMEYVAGERLDHYCDRTRLTVLERLALFQMVCDAVELAHQQQVVHRDLKPSNVLVTEEGIPKLLDFGIAKLLAPEMLEQSVEVTAEFQRLLTPAFASPEQIRGELVTPASDVYALGVLLYILLSGHSPYDLDTGSASTAEQVVCETEPVAPSVAARQFEETTGPDGEPVALTPEAVSVARRTDPESLCAELEAGLDDIVLKALEKAPQDRFSTAAALSAAIAAYADRHIDAPDPALRSAPGGQGVAARPEAPGDVATEVASEPAYVEWGHLKVVRRIGQGAFGEVFECRDNSLDTTVALKLFRANAGDSGISSEVATRALKEGKLLARVRHPNVLVVHGAAVHHETVGLWMEYVDGRTLEQLLKRQGRFGAREASLIGIDLCSALSAVHAEGVVHRDIKAQNVIREEGGRIVLTDFGSGEDLAGSGSWHRGGTAGTPLYMAPEVMRGGVATIRSDVYSMGVLLYRMVAGAFPAEAESWQELLGRHQRGSLTPVRDRRPDLPHRFARVIDKALASDPAERFASAGEMQQALEVAADLTAEFDVRWFQRLGADSRLAAVAKPFAWILAGAIAVASLWALVGSTPEDSASSAPPPSESAAHRRIAVAQFENLTGDPDVDRLEKVLPDMFLSILVGSPYLTLYDIGVWEGEPSQTLGADFLMTGSLVGGGAHLRVVVKLTDLATAEIARSDVLPIGDSTTMLSAAEALAGEIRIDQAIKITGSQDQQEAISRLKTYSLAAYEDYILGRERLRDGQYERAIPFFRTAVAEDGCFAHAYDLLANAYQVLGEDDLGIEAASEAMKCEAMTPVERLMIERRLAGLEGDISAEGEKIEQLAIMEPANPDWRYVLGWYSLTHARDCGRSIGEYEEGLRLDPIGQPRIYTYLAWAYLSCGEPGAAIDRYERFHELRPQSAQALGRLAWARLLIGRYEEARVDLEKALELDPDEPLTYEVMAEYLLAVGRPSEAIDQYRLHLDRVSGRSLVELGNLGLAAAYREAGDAESSLELIHGALGPAPTRLTGLWLRGLGELDLEDVEAARVTVDSMQAVANGAASLLDVEQLRHLQGVVSAAEDETELAILFLEESLDFPSVNRSIFGRSLGMAYEQAGDPTSAERAYLDALDFNPNHGHTLLELGLLYEGQSRVEEALEAYGRLLAVWVDPTDRFADIVGEVRSRVDNLQRRNGDQRSSGVGTINRASSRAEES